MSVRKPLVIVTRKLPEAVETRMRELFDARLNHDDNGGASSAFLTAFAESSPLTTVLFLDRFAIQSGM